MGRTLILTSPLMHGPDVVSMQKLLNAKGFGHGLTTDGQYGMLSGQAAYRAKYWLGYRTCDKRAGDALRAYLTGKQPATAAMKAVRAARLKRQPTTRTIRQKALALAKSKVGTVESPPNSNRQMFGAWYGFNGVPWCAIFVTWAFVNSGSKSFAKGIRWSYCPYVLGDARAGRNGLTLTTHPMPGDLILFDWDRDGISDHIGIVESMNPLVTIEGNTSPSNNSNGGQVMRRTDRAGLAQAFVHVSG